MKTKITEHGWIPITERLPEKDEVYLTCYKFDKSGSSYVRTLSYYVRERHFQYEGYAGLTVTHWMPLPEQPKNNT